MRPVEHPGERNDGRHGRSPRTVPEAGSYARSHEVTMKEGIHPKYEPATITCACGSVVQTRSTGGSYSVDICNQCHPFYTGKQKLIDTAGRVEKFRRKYAKA